MTSRDSSMMSTDPFDGDSAARRHDKFGRRNLATQIAQALVSTDKADSFVVAIDGHWGSGKSWLMHETASVLSNDMGSSTARVVHFNPWLIGEEGELILEFMLQIYFELRAFSKTSNLVSDAARSILKYAKLLRYARPLKYVPILELSALGHTAEAIQTATADLEKALESETLSLSDARQAARDAVEALPARLIVLIDDIDRLRAREVRAIMQLIKAVADFPNTSFLIALDTDQVAKALTSSGDIDDGERYLQKIVQLNIRVPMPARSDIAEDVQTRLSKALGANGRMLRPFEKSLLEDASQRVTILCDNPRDVARWANHFSWAYRALGGSVNAADLCVAEALQLNLGRKRWSELLSLLGVHLEGVLDRTTTTDYMRWAQLQDTGSKEAGSAFVKQLSRSQLSALYFLFPSFNNPSARNPDRALEHCRLASDQILMHYARFKEGADEVSGRQLENWLENPSELTAALGDSGPSLSERGWMLLRAISTRLDFESMPSRSESLNALVQALQRFAASEFGAKVWPNTEAVAIAAQVLLCAAGTQGKLEALTILEAIPLPELAAACEQFVKLEAEAHSQSPSKVDRIKGLLPTLRSAVVARIQTTVDADTLPEQRLSLYLLHALHRLGDAASVRDTIDRLTATPGDVERLLKPIASLHVEYWRLNFPPIVAIARWPRKLVACVQAIDNPEFDTLKAVYGRIPDDELGNLEAEATGNRA